MPVNHRSGEHTSVPERNAATLDRAADVIALTDTLIAVMSAELFWEVLRRYETVCAAVLRRLTQFSKVRRSSSDSTSGFSLLSPMPVSRHRPPARR